MKIAFITNIPTHYVTLLFQLMKERCTVDFYFTGGHEDYWNQQNELRSGNIGGKVLEGFFLGRKFKISPGLLKVALNRYDVFIKTIDDRFALLFIFLAAKVLKKPFILWTGLWAHPATVFHRLTSGFIGYIYRHSDALVVYGDHVKRYLISLEVDERKIFCAPHSIDNRFFEKEVSPERIARLKEELGLAERKVILYVGRFEREKGLDYLIDALSRIVEFKYTFLLIGNGSQEDLLKDQCRERSIDHRFLGHKANEELREYYALANIFVLPSITTKDFKEPWGLVVNEAMNQACPVVATNAVGAAAGGLVEDGVNGYIVPEKDSEALREAIEKLLRDDDQRIKMGRNAKAKIAGWTPQRTLEGFMRAIEYVTQNKADRS